jgi:hypothetical protein
MGKAWHYVGAVVVVVVGVWIATAFTNPIASVAGGAKS